MPPAPHNAASLADATHSSSVNTGQSNLYPAPVGDDGYLSFDQHEYLRGQRVLPGVAVNADDALANAQLIDENTAAVLEEKNSKVTDGRKFYMSKGGRIRRQQKPHKDRSYFGTHQASMTENEVFMVRSNYVMGTLETFRNNPQDDRRYIRVTPDELQRLTFLRLQNGQHPPAFSANKTTAEARDRVNKSYKPRTR